jgi:DNA-binding phage protein
MLLVAMPYPVCVSDSGLQRRCHATESEWPNKAHRHERERFAQLLRHYHARSGKTLTAAAQLAGISPGYLNDLFSGKRCRINWNTLYVLCTEVWIVTEEEGKALLWLRHKIERGNDLRAYLTRDVLWQFASRGDMRTIAVKIGLDYSYLLQIMNGKRRPTVQVVMSLYQYLGLDPKMAARLYTNEIRSEWESNVFAR